MYPIHIKLNIMMHPQHVIHQLLQLSWETCTPVKDIWHLCYSIPWLTHIQPQGPSELIRIDLWHYSQKMQEKVSRRKHMKKRSRNIKKKKKDVTCFRSILKQTDNNEKLGSYNILPLRANTTPSSVCVFVCVGGWLIQKIFCLDQNIWHASYVPSPFNFKFSIFSQPISRKPTPKPCLVVKIKRYFFFSYMKWLNHGVYIWIIRENLSWKVLKLVFCKLMINATIFHYTFIGLQMVLIV